MNYTPKKGQWLEFEKTKEQRVYKAFKVAIVSSNANSFGLYGMVIVSKDGEAYEVGANNINVKPQGTIISIPMEGNEKMWGVAGFEIPRLLPKAPSDVIKQVWGTK